MTTISEKSETKLAEVQVPDELAIIPGGPGAVFPAMMVPVVITNEKSSKLVDDAVAGDKIVGVFAQRQDTEEQPPTNLYDIGTAANVVKMLKMPDGTVHVLLQGIARIKLNLILQVDPYIKAKIEKVDEILEQTPELDALIRNILALFQKLVSLAPHLPDELTFAALNMTEPGMIADFIAVHSHLKPEESQEILETLNVKERLEKLTGFVNRELEILELGSKIQSQVKSEMDKSQREFVLREQLKAIQKELGEVDERTLEVNEIRAKIEEAKLPPEAIKEAERELDRLEKMPPQAAEYTTARTYLEWLTSLPWAISTEDNLDVNRAQQILDEDHYDLEKVKERVLDYLAVRGLKGEDMKSPILCFVGPPGTGKTSIGKSIARSLGRNFIRISLGGVRDEAEIRGHRRTYVGALPGRIIQSIRRAGSNNPVFMLDEIDKIGADFRGDPSAALLEALDPEQNFAFSDHYLEVPFDLSKVMFITTANLIDPIPPALQDRMEVLELPGYTEVEKLHIARKFLIPKQLEEHGLSNDMLKITDNAILATVRNYTREAGLRNLEREIGTICRKSARQIAQGDKKKATVSPKNLEDFLGQRKFRHEVAERADEVGVATGLAWTPAGGDVLFIESILMPGNGSLTLTGQLGDVMQESAKAALSYARSKAVSLGIDKDFYSKNDLHIHVPAGAIPKDGPSAGVTMAASLVSALSKRPVNKDIAMTGEITLRGKVLPVGGIKEKVLAANRAGIKKVMLPRDNDKDLKEVPEHIKKGLDFAFVERIDEVLKETLK
ncbi:MAG: endopeptidase La [Dehalococcoidia bacterium]|nr:MAG: endopeptidase La [Dehalococcoidia bacterium]